MSFEVRVRFGLVRRSGEYLSAGVRASLAIPPHPSTVVTLLRVLPPEG